MSAEDDLRLAWIAHRDGREGRRDALLTLAAAAAVEESPEEAWPTRVRDFLVGRRRDHLFATFVELDEAIGDRRVANSIGRLRLSFPADRVAWLVRRDASARGPFTGRSTRVATLLDEMLAPPRLPRTRETVRLGPSPGSSSDFASIPIPVGALAPLGAVTPREAGLPDHAGPILAFYLTTLLGVAGLCALVLDGMRDDKRAA